MALDHRSIVMAAAGGAASVITYLLYKRARQALTSTADISLMNPDSPILGQDKFLGGVLGSDGCIYGIPGHSKHVLKIDPSTGEISLIGGPYHGKFKWLRGALGPDGNTTTKSYCN